MFENQVKYWLEQRISALNLPLSICLPDQQLITPAGSPKVTIMLRTPRALLTLANPTLGKLAKAYVEQEFDVRGNLRDVVEIVVGLCDAGAEKGRKKINHAWKWRRHTLSADRRAITHHYDVSNDFYALWLDRWRVYSCAYFKTPEDSLDLAQEQKLDLICRKLDLQQDERFLDIGCGWGGLILWAAQRYRAKATGITLSRNQFEYVGQKIKELGLQDCCQVMLCDYRELDEREPFDKIASVGMFEHVGRRNLPLYFGKIYRLLKPGGLVMNHGITLTSPGCGELGSDRGKFIEDYVFPGGELVHVSVVMETMSQQKLECLDAENLRAHYAKTLWHWVERLDAKQDQARRIVGEKIFRTWQVYMAGSADAFERGWISIYQLLAGRPLADGRLVYPLTREFVYQTI
ncbi:MAG TPA: class I SAM-dependent methyltransferase [Burkholderiales bacterium]|nr:class I SAM-dependent methyltransferase [Burkholderiales bacterium]